MQEKPQTKLPEKQETSRWAPLLFALGLGMYWCWRDGVYSFDPGLGWTGADSSPLAMSLPCLGGVAAAAVLAFSDRSALSPEASRRMPLVFGVLCSSLTLASYALLGLRGGQSAWAFLFEAIAFGLGLLLLVHWGSLTTSMDPRDATLGVAGSLAAGAAGYLLVSAIPLAPAALLAIAALPAASGLACAKAQDVCPTPLHTGDVARGAVPPAIWPCVVVVAVLVSFIGVEELLRVAFTLPESSGEDLPALFTLVTQLGALAVSAAILAVVAVSKKTPSFDSLARSLVPLMVLGFLSLLLAGSETPWLCFAILGAGYWCLRLLTWETAAAVSRKADVSPRRVFAAVEGSVCLVVVAAQILAAPESIVSSSKPAVVSAAILAAVLGAMVILDAKFLGALEDHVSPVPADAAPGPATLLDTAGACTLLTERCRLTARESEVLVLLARGRSLPYIQEELGIAVGTAQAHVRHIYDKLGVHSRQQLLDMVEKAKSSGPTP